MWQKGNLICESRYKKKGKKDDNNNDANNENIVEIEVKERVAMVYVTQIGMVLNSIWLQWSNL